MKLLFITLLFFPLCSLAQLTAGDEFVSSSQRVSGTNVGDNQSYYENGTSEVDEPDSGNLGNDLDSTGGFQEAEDGGLGTANEVGSSGSMMQMVGAAAAIGFGVKCGTIGGQWACPLSALAAQIAMQAAASKSNGFDTAQFFDQDGVPAFDSTSEFGDITGEQLNDQISNLQAMGYKFNEDGSVTDPNGNKVDGDKLSTFDGMVKGGMTPQQASAAQGIMKKAQTDVAKKAGVDPETVVGTGIAATGGAAGSAAFETSGQGGGDQIIEEIEYRGGRKKKDNRMPASKAADYSKNFNGTPIGIGMANIFVIVKKKYNEKRNQKTEFIHKEY